ncbi:hypothetical protein [Streptacidiphilus cavernicola]|uniref:Uncharacterized protein n=1 Tax=Streptacidiphilus cavernicola TaxID=3342716 RepID=A0ABV6VS79_9ACTN
MSPTPIALLTARDARVARVLSRTDLGREHRLTPQLAADVSALAGSSGPVRLRIGVTGLPGDRAAAEEFAALLAGALALEPCGTPGRFLIGCGQQQVTVCHLLLVLLPDGLDGRASVGRIPVLDLPEPPRAVFVVGGDGGGGGPEARDARARWLRGRLGVMLGPSAAGNPTYAVAVSAALRALPGLGDGVGAGTGTEAGAALSEPSGRAAATAWERSGLPTLLRREVVPALDRTPALVAGLTVRRLRAAVQDIRLSCRDQAVAAGWPTDADGYPSGLPAPPPGAAAPAAASAAAPAAASGTAEDRWAQLEAFTVAPVAVRAGRRRSTPEEKP